MGEQFKTKRNTGCTGEHTCYSLTNAVEGEHLNIFIENCLIDMSVCYGSQCLAAIVLNNSKVPST